MPTLQKIKMYYDPLGRLVRTVNPDKSEQRVVYGVPVALNTPDNFAPTPWENFSYDADDLAPLTNGVSYGCDYTPKSSLVDGLGRTIRTTEHLGSSADDITMLYSYDVRGNLLLVKDPYYRNVFEHVYDLRAPQKGEDGNNQPLPPIKTTHIDQGTSTILFDATGKPIEKYDAKGAHSLSAYDVISRPVDAWAKNNASASTLTLRSHIEYGDTAGSGSSGNMNGKPYQSYDEAGMVETSDYDFKGNLLAKTRYVINSATLKAQLVGYNSFIIDWTGLPGILDMGMPFQTDLQYDALNRVTVMTLPQNVTGNRLDITPTYNRAGALEKVDYDGTNYVENIAYNAKGQRLLIAYGNDMMTRYAYDPVTFRLLRYKTEGYVKSQIGNTITYAYQSGTNEQDDAFNYDLVGNILNIFTRVTDCGINSSPLGSNALDRNFNYDAIYRVLTANGRESNSQNQNTYLYTNAPAPGSPNANNVRSYGHVYSYDKLGNITKMIQTGTNGFTRNFVYNTGVNTLQRVNDVSSVLIEAFSYDANGNQLTAGTTRNYKWNHADQLICYFNKAGSANPTVYTQYDYSGQDRVSKLVRTGTAGSPIYERTIYIDGIFEYVRLENGPTYQKNYIHIMDDSTRIAEVRVNVGATFPGDIADSVVYQLGDQIGSSVVRLNNSGGVIDREEYYPFGDSSLRTFSYKRYRYVSKERDSESGLYYYGARYYAGWTCRFISVDPLASKYAQLTPYNYASDNPITHFDIDGMQTPNQAESQPSNPQNTNQPTSNSGNTPLAAPSVGATGKPIEQGPKFDYSFLPKSNLSAAKPTGDGYPQFKALDPIQAKTMAINAQARANRNFLAQHNELELQAGTNPVFQSIAQGALMVTTGGFASRAIPALSGGLRASYSFAANSSSRIGYLWQANKAAIGDFTMNGLANATSNFMGQAFINQDLQSIDYADVAFAFTFNKANMTNVFLGASFSSIFDISPNSQQNVYFGQGKSGAKIAYEFATNSAFGALGVKIENLNLSPSLPFISNSLTGATQSYVSKQVFGN